ncbi:hypothetical protein INT47_005342, partial [Mucor saturninus]
PVCHWCKMAGHLRKDCPELAKRVCFSCNGHGHTAKFCKAKKKNSDAVDLHEYLRSCNRTKDDGANTPSADPHVRKAGDKTGTLGKGSASSKWASASEVIDVEMDSVPDVQLELSESAQTIGSSMCDDMSEDEDLADGVSGDLSVGDSGSGGGSGVNYDAGVFSEVGGISPGAVSSRTGGGISGAGGDRSGAGAGAAGRRSGGGGPIHSKKGKGVTTPSVVSKKMPGIHLIAKIPPKALGKPLRLGSLNARSIFKSTSPQIQKEFISFLRNRSLSLDVLCIQEVSSFHQAHLTDDQILQFCSFLFPHCSVVVSKYCAIICLNSGLYLDDTAVSLDERCVFGSVLDLQHNVLCRVASIYVPAQSSDRPLFLNNFLSLPFFSDMSTAPWLLMGDLNMNLHNVKVTGHSTVSSWFDWVRSHFDNCFPSGLPTHTQGNSRTTIDYVFGHRSLATRLVNGMIRKVSSAYTDHCLLSIDLVPARVDIGPGCWRFNPTLLDDAAFLVLLDKTVVLFFDSIVCVDNPGDGGGGEPVPVQDIWESFKVLLKCCAQKYTRGAKARLKNKVASLQQERTILLSTASGIITSDDVLTQSGSGSILGDSSKLKELDQLIDNQIQKETRECMLRSATRWHELGEHNNKYFYRVIKERQSKQTIQSLKCSATGSVLVNSDDIIREARGFYQELYTPDLIDDAAVDSLLASIPDDVVLSPEDSDSLTDPILMDTLQDLVGHTPLGKSPGLDGLPFEVYKYLFKSSADFRTMLLGILNDALIGEFPTSWQQTRMVLLFKKGDPMLLKNWRPLSLINSDAKLFTKLLANRLNTVLPQLINPYQTGFMPNRLISDNGWLNQMFMANARDVAPGIPQVAVLLDQEKTYDRIHPDYLRKEHIYIQRLISGPNTIDFVSPWLVRGIQLYTGHSSILLWFLYPAKFQNLLKRIVPLAQLGKLLQKLPPLSLSNSWSARWLLDLPLQCVVTVGDAVNTWSPTLIPSSVPLRYLVSDIFSWNQTTDNLKNTRVVTASKVKEVRRALYPLDGWFAATGFLPTALHNQTNRDVLLPRWLPALYHWTIPQGRGNMVTVSGIRPGNLRWYWHPDRTKFEIHAVIPQVVPTRFLLRPSLWRLFWSLDMTSKAFTPWWRLLQDCIGYRAKLHRWSPTKYPCASCPICLVSSSEDLFHFVVGCFDKWQYWCNVISLLGIGDIFETEFDVWSGLVSLCDIKQKPLSADILVIIGSGFATLWKYHWRCVIDGDLWNSHAAINMFQQDHSVLIADNLASQSPLAVNDSLVMPSG